MLPGTGEGSDPGLSTLSLHRSGGSAWLMGQATSHIFIQNKAGRNLFSSGVTERGSQHLGVVCGHEPHSSSWTRTAAVETNCERDSYYSTVRGQVPHTCPLLSHCLPRSSLTAEASPAGSFPLSLLSCLRDSVLLSGCCDPRR